MAASGSTGGAPILSALPCSRPDLFSRYDPELSKKPPPRLSFLPTTAAVDTVVVVRNEGTSVLVRELERVHLKGKTTAGGAKRAAAGRAQGGRKQPRARGQQNVAPQGEAEAAGGDGGSGGSG